MDRRAPTILIAELARSIAAWTAVIDGNPVAVVNSAARDNPELRAQAHQALEEAGIQGDALREVLGWGTSQTDGTRVDRD